MQNKVITGFFWKFGEQISSQLVSFVLSIILARLLAPKDYGVIALVQIFISIAQVFVTSGFGNALIQKRDADETDFSTIFYLSELMSVIVYVILFIAAPWISVFYDSPELTSILRVFALQLPLSAFNGIQQAYISKHLMFKKVFISTTVAAIMSGVVGVVMAYFGFGVWSLVWQALSNTIFVSVTLAAQVKWHPQFKFSWRAGKPLVSFGWKLLVSSLLGQFFNQLRSLIIGKFYTATVLAFYNRGQKFPDLITTNIDGTVSTVLFPTLSNINDDLDKVKRAIRKSIRTSTFVIMPLLFGLAATSRPIILLMLTEKWSAAIPFMQILCFSDVFDTVSNTNMQAIQAIGRSDIMLKLEFIKKPIYLILLIIGINISFYAVAWTMVIYNVVAVAINMTPNRKLLGYNIKEQLSDMLPALLSSMIMYTVVEFLGNVLPTPILLTLLIQVSAGIAIYVGIAVAFKMEGFKNILGILKKE